MYTRVCLILLFIIQAHAYEHKHRTSYSTETNVYTRIKDVTGDVETVFQ